MKLSYISKQLEDRPQSDAVRLDPTFTPTEATIHMIFKAEAGDTVALREALEFIHGQVVVYLQAHPAKVDA